MVDVVDLLDPVVLLERHVVEAGVGADLGERRPQAGQSLDGRVGADQLVVLEDRQAVLVLDRDDRVGEVAVGPGLGGPVVRLGGERVDVLAVPAPERRDQVGADALRHEAGPQRGGRVGCPGAAVGAHRHPAHRLDATGDDQVLEAAADAGGGLVDRFQAGGAEAVELDAGHGLRVARREGRGLGDVTTLLADRGDDTEHHVVHAVRVQRGVADLDLIEQAHHQVDRLDLVQGTDLLSLAARRANVVVHECFCHDRPSCTGGMRREHDCDTVTVTVVKVVHQVWSGSPAGTAQTDRPDRTRGTDCGRDRRVTARAADARRADQPGRDECAQRPLLHDQGSGAAADPPGPLRLLHARPRRAPRAGPGAAEPRVHARRDREVRRQHPARRHPRGHRPAAGDARPVAARGARSR